MPTMARRNADSLSFAARWPSVHSSSTPRCYAAAPAATRSAHGGSSQYTSKVIAEIRDDLVGRNVDVDE